MTTENLPPELVLSFGMRVYALNKFGQPDIWIISAGIPVAEQVEGIINRSKRFGREYEFAEDMTLSRLNIGGKEYYASSNLNPGPIIDQVINQYLFWMGLSDIRYLKQAFIGWGHSHK